MHPLRCSTAPRSRRATLLALAGLPALLAGGCASTPPAAPGARPAGSAATPSARPDGVQRRAPLDIEQQWLQAWFKDTPVTITPRDGAALEVEVPRAFCFDGGRTQVKPPLAAVLDKVAESLRRQARLRLALLAAPGDAERPELALPRAAHVRQHLRGRGVPEARLAAPARSSADAVQLRLQLLDEAS
ncbi:MAG: hypothetical protein U1F56_17300 [Rubrivivax sp.]